jgi:hypothetical protein
MPKRVSKTRDGKVNAENISGRTLPRRGGVRNETGGKVAGVRPGLRSTRTVVNYARRGRS